MIRPRVGQKKPPTLGSTICCGQTWARKSRRDSTVRFVTAKSFARKNHHDSAVRFFTVKSCPEKATKTRHYDLLRPRIGLSEPPGLDSTICNGQEFSRKSVTAKTSPEKATKTRQFKNDQELSRKSNFLRQRVRQYNFLQPNVGQKKPPRLGSAIWYGQTCPRLATTNRTAESWWLCRNKSHGRVFVAFSCQRLAVPSRTMALSGQLLGVRTRTADSWWLFLAFGRNKSYGALGRNKSYCRVLVAVSGQLFAVTNCSSESWWLFLAKSCWP